MPSNAPLVASSRRLLTAAALLLLGAAAPLFSGCIGCGAEAVPSDSSDASAFVTRDGVVVFEDTAVGGSLTFNVPIRDSADVDETLMSATVTGADADEFVAEAKFPIDMKAGKVVHIEVTYRPTRSSIAKAQLVVQTEAMGPSPIDLEGYPATDAAD